MCLFVKTSPMNLTRFSCSSVLKYVFYKKKIFQKKEFQKPTSSQMPLPRTFEQLHCLSAFSRPLYHLSKFPTLHRQIPLFLYFRAVGDHFLGLPILCQQSLSNLYKTLVYRFLVDISPTEYTNHPHLVRSAGKFLKNIVILKFKNFFKFNSLQLIGLNSRSILRRQWSVYFLSTWRGSVQLFLENRHIMYSHLENWWILWLKITLHLSVVTSVQPHLE